MQQRQGLNNNTLYYMYYCRQELPATPVVCQCAGISSRQSCATSNGSTTHSTLNQQDVEEQSKAFSLLVGIPLCRIQSFGTKQRDMQVTAPQNAPHPFAKAKEAKNQKSPITKPSGHWTSMINRAAIVYQDWYSGCTCQSSVCRAFNPPRRSKTQEERRRKSRLALHFFKLCLMPTETLTSGQPRCLLFHANHATRQPYLTEPGQVTLPFA